jgi:hypothetical protein
MSAISRFVEDQPPVLLAHVFITAQSIDTLDFEVLEANAQSLHQHLGKKQLLTCDGDAPFWGELIRLEPSTATAAGLTMLRDRPTLKGTIRIFSVEPAMLQ